MQVLSVMQPWATLLALGLKRLETRTWRTGHRGPLAIHAARRRTTHALPPGWGAKLAASRERLGLDAWPDLFPRGAVLGVAELLDCVKVEALPPGEPDGVERLLGDFAANRWVWRLAAARPLAVPLLVRGQLGVFSADLPEPLPGLAPGEPGASAPGGREAAHVALA